MTVIQLLKKTRELIGKGKWIKGTVFRDKLGRFSNVENANMFCLYGGMKKALHDNTGRYESRLLAVAAGALNQTEIVKGLSFHGNYVNWNDEYSRTKGEVLTAIDQAVELLESGEVQ